MKKNNQTIVIKIFIERAKRSFVTAVGKFLKYGCLIMTIFQVAADKYIIYFFIVAYC